MTEIAEVHDSQCIAHQRLNGRVKTNGQGIVMRSKKNKNNKNKKVMRDRACFPLLFVHLSA